MMALVEKRQRIGWLGQLLRINIRKIIREIGFKSNMSKFNSFPNKKNFKNELRKVGFEFEFSSMEPQKCASLLADLFGGTIHFEHSLNIEVRNTILGTFIVELDASAIKDLVKKLEE